MLKHLFVLRADKAPARVFLIGFLLTGLFAAMIGRLVWLGVAGQPQGSVRAMTSAAISIARPDIVDRNGTVMATDIKSFSVFAEPRKILDAEEAAELISAALPDLDAKQLRDKLRNGKGFAWVKREISPHEYQEVFRLGIPGVGFLPENKRVYPNGTAAAHVLGAVNFDNEGIAGLEKYLDGAGLRDLNGAGFSTSATELAPVELSIDLGAQHALRDELAKAMAKFQAKAAAGVVLDVTNGEIVALVSLPDFNPNVPADALKPDRINRINVGVYEMGSTFKALTTAMALDSGRFSINSQLDATQALRYGRFRINDYRGQNRFLTVPESFVHSSNIAMARMALALGPEAHQAFLRKMGQFDRLRTELPESATPLLPAKWGEINTATISFGHGIAVAPLQAIMAVGALVNGGTLIRPTFLKGRDVQPRILGSNVISPQTGEALRYLMRLNAERGSAAKASVAGYYIGGKTGTAEKVFGGRYAKNKLLTAFMGIAPADQPRYLFLTILDEPQPLPETFGFATSGWNAVPVTGTVMARVLPLLGVPPRPEDPLRPFPVMARLGAWGTVQ
ncbi:penicillin-binding protein 2 [Bosea sp. (in: a-proteobacteria)]|uniref:peptidoglycan D,D-transpeptidase FtsI family protein n=1 Tax=Bosea sp. (in: a-proteobacteria) TaxID=1871050 RepID=UPI001AD32EA6|nr:penicillin-binding protein 2 [Bosea sp. (in: a-proteobacteria)]MBN9435814.1 penicillin-binding protein 2 [Bosea sp. (in: a-proteobacteria)]